MSPVKEQKFVWLPLKRYAIDMIGFRKVFKSNQNLNQQIRKFKTWTLNKTKQISRKQIVWWVMSTPKTPYLECRVIGNPYYFFPGCQAVEGKRGQIFSNECQPQGGSRAPEEADERTWVGGGGFICRQRNPQHEGLATTFGRTGKRRRPFVASRGFDRWKLRPKSPLATQRCVRKIWTIRHVCW